eukprot:scaffold296195_cov35-Tisochrysis_lutea.AAC.2
MSARAKRPRPPRLGQGATNAQSVTTFGSSDGYAPPPRNTSTSAGSCEGQRKGTQMSNGQSGHSATCGSNSAPVPISGLESNGTCCAHPISRNTS